MTERTYGALLAEATGELRRGEPVILDATFGQARWREAAAAVAADCNVACDFLLCEASAAVVAARIETRSEEVGVVSEGTWEVYLSQREAFESVAAIDGTRLQRIDTSGALRESVAAALAGLEVAAD
jgi:predicted kinase